MEGRWPLASAGRLDPCCIAELLSAWSTAQHRTAYLPVLSTTDTQAQPSMSAIPTFRIWRPIPTSTSVDAVRSILTPASPCTRAPVARFSTSTPAWKADNNKNRGVSAVRHTGLRPRQTLSVIKGQKKTPMPVPVKRTTQIQGDPNHGLYDFFQGKQLMLTPLEESQHGTNISLVRNRLISN